MDRTSSEAESEFSKYEFTGEDTSLLRSYTEVQLDIQNEFDAFMEEL
jgi:hypothetical protein